jgi:transposase-like protein
MKEPSRWVCPHCSDKLTHMYKMPTCKIPSHTAQKKICTKATVNSGVWVWKELASVVAK